MIKSRRVLYFFFKVSVVLEAENYDAPSVRTLIPCRPDSNLLSTQSLKNSLDLIIIRGVYLLFSLHQVLNSEPFVIDVLGYVEDEFLGYRFTTQREHE